MAETSWNDILSELGITAQPSAGPADAEGHWHQLTAAFGTKSFLRALTNETSLVLECSPPTARAKPALESAGWTTEQDAAPFVFARPFPDSAADFSPLWDQVRALCEATGDDDGDGFLAALEPAGAAAERAEDGKEKEAPAPATLTGAFETIGDDERPMMAPGAFDFAIGPESDHVEVVLGFGAELDRAAYDRLESRLTRDLRAKYDVSVQIVGGNEVGVKLRHMPATRVALHIEPALVVDRPTLSETEDAAGGYFQSLADLANSGIDPLVFLGVSEPHRAARAETKAAVHTGEEPAGDGTLLVDDEPEMPAPEDEDEAGEIVFAVEDEPEAGDPLEAGRYDDPRLGGNDASTPLVDVVLRHPGYSDRRVGQVLSILLSIEYSKCLELMQNAPTVIAWGVAQERAQTMKTVVEGAGGKVFLAEPGQFAQE